MLRVANEAVRRGKQASRLQPVSVINAGLLVHLWWLLAAMDALTETRRNNSLREISFWSPAKFLLVPMSSESSKSCRVLFVNSSLPTRGLWRPPGNLFNMLSLSPSSLEVQSLPLCHLRETPDKTCRRLLHGVEPGIDEARDSEQEADPRRIVEAATEQRET
ncbi:hypothetical protein TraAM80_01656 [Trypanosoma rangeli]|uniref:Uncharacterized protein n=1 Tax=Trypanosoma rangeli TaxID=5698 RepID=A0A3R7NZH0_TRYRA|nr:uncharacterized protein TraAM80_01656 [Trypanosoma rangeli]RNF10217.1 hypothetical protein TraAM80_01656 [Trypanosoma rangeli]|eukprot:RNF10217.1 hypothetical protein TraAM80_01656 [Trypanosoma rangeli]